MYSYLRLAWRNKQSRGLLISQACALAVLLTLFGVFMPWIDSDPISSFPTDKYGNPEASAKYYGINHGKPYFYSDSRHEKPVLFYSVIFCFVALYLYILVAVYYVYKINGEKLPWFGAKSNENK